VKDFKVHAFTDGRDCDPNSGVEFIGELQEHLENTGGQLASVIGRYYAMDRDKRWERVKIAYDTLVHAKGEETQDVLESIRNSYGNNVTDEFLKPIIHVDQDWKPYGKIEEGDVVICFNFRTDRGREITQVLTQIDIPEQEMKKLSLHYVTMTNYDDTFQGVNVMFDKDNLVNTLGEVLSKQGKKQIRIAETEKYPHVTFFFSGGREELFEGERRLLCPSPKVATYDLQPEMSAMDIRDKIVPELKSASADFICLNFANPDMVGHTGVFEAAVKACETVDSCAKDVVNAALKSDYLTIIIADHGNSDIMINPDGSPHTAHTTNLVPCIFVDYEIRGETQDGKLADLAPTILSLMDLEIPSEMDGDQLIKPIKVEV
jgi:2,3-bisphosphoglycerate-independent phosphoglycerate mutase